jgi:hypothetical protein
MELDLKKLHPRTAWIIEIYNEQNPDKPIKSLEDLAALPEYKVLQIPNCGRKSLNDMKNLLEEYGLAFAPNPRFQGPITVNSERITLRDQFAMAALPLVLPAPFSSSAEVAEAAFALADAMMAARTR